MKKLIAVAACAALAACGSNETAEEPVDGTFATGGTMDTGAATPVDTSQIAGTYEMTAEDGTVMMRTVNANGTYTTTTTDGTAGETGTARMQGDAVCYDPEGPASETCWTSGEVGPDGSFEATSGTGDTITVRKTA